MSDFSDEYFSRVRDALVPAPKATDRDVSNRALRLGDQYQPRTEVVDSGGQFTAADEWIQCISLAPQQASGIVRLLAEGGGFYAGDEPFYVSGPRIFTVDTGGQVLVQRSVRRELLSRMATRDFPNNGAAASEVYDGTLNLALALGQWAVLDADLTWSAQTFGVFPGGYGGPFGRNAPSKDLAGRYYELMFRVTPSVGSVYIQMSVEIAPGVYEAGPGLSPIRSGNRGSARVGDDYAAVLNDATWGVTNYSQAKAQGAPRWGLIVVPSAAATVVAEVSVLRQGF